MLRLPGGALPVALALLVSHGLLAQGAPTSPATLISKGIGLARSGDHRAAADAFARALQASPEDTVARYNLALALYNSGAFREARAHFLVVLRAKADDPEALRGLGLTHLALHEYPQAVAALKQAAQLAPTDAPALAGLGRAYLAVEQPRKALDVLRTAHRLKPLEPGIAYDLGRAASAAGDNAEAMRAFGRALVLAPTSYNSALGLANAYHNAGKHTLVIETLQPFEDSPSASPEAFRLLMDAYQALGLDGEANAAGERLADALPAAEAAPLRRRLAGRYMDLLQWPEAVTHLLKAAEAAPADVQTHIDLATCYHSMGNLKEELSRWQQASDLAPNNTAISLGLASALASGDNRKAALAVLRKALQSAPASSELLRLAADTARELELAEEAEGYLRRILALDPRNWPARLAVAESLVARGQAAKAMLEAGEALLAPKPPPAAFAAVAQIAEQAGNLEYAAECWRRLSEADAAQRTGAAINRARVLTQLRRPADAVAACEQALRSAPGHIGLVMALAKAHQACGDDQSAAAALEGLLGKHPDLDAARAMLAESLSWLGEHDRAREQIRQVMRSESLDRAGCEALALVSARAGRPRDAISTFLSMLPQSPIEPTLLALLTGLCEAEADPADGGRRLAAVFQASPERTAVGMAAAHLLATGGKVAEAADLLEGLSRDTETGQEALRRLVALHTNWGHPERALNPLRRLLERDVRAAWVIAVLAELEQRPLLAADAADIASDLAEAPAGSPAFWLAAARLAEFMKRVPDGYARMVALAATQPRDPGVQVGLAALALADGNPAQAVAAIGQVPNEARNDAALLLTLARAQVAMGDDAAAANTLRLSMKSGLAQASEHALYAGIEHRGRRLEYALLHVATALSLSPGDEHAQALLQTLLEERRLTPSTILDALADIYRVHPDAEVVFDTVAALRAHPDAAQACDRWLQWRPRRALPEGSQAYTPAGKSGLAREADGEGDAP